VLEERGLTDARSRMNFRSPPLSDPFWSGFGEQSVSYPVRAVMSLPSNKDAGLWKYPPQPPFTSEVKCAWGFTSASSQCIFMEWCPHTGTIYLLLLLYSLCWSTIWNLNSLNRSIFLNPTLTEGSNTKIKSVGPMQRIIQKNVPRRLCPQRDFNAWYRGFGLESDLRCHCC
jgi:hypothetical protein